MRLVRVKLNGVDQRLSVTVWQSGASIISRYVVDSARQGAVLAATANSQTTFYLYGLGVIAEQTSTWAYYLKDGQNTVRQMTDAAAVVTLARTYDPFGQVIALLATRRRRKKDKWNGVLLVALFVGMGVADGSTACVPGPFPQAHEWFERARRGCGLDAAIAG
jgi:hypothetical protein